MAVEAGAAGASIEDKLEHYVRSILDLGQGNKAIYFAVSPDGSSGWKIKSKGFRLSDNALYELLERGQVTLLRFSIIQNEFREGCIEPGESDWRDVERGLGKLYSRSREFVRDYGVSICHVVYGFLVWQESPVSGKGVWVRSPLLVAEANLERRVDRRRGHVVYQLSLAAPFRINEALVEALRFQYRVNLIEGLAEEGEVNLVELEEVGKLEDVLRKAEAIISEMGWRVEREVWIAALYFGNVGIYHDARKLLESGKLAGSPIIRALCGEERDPPIPHPGPPSDREIDLLETPLPADRSQCEVLWYAERGSNLVVHGPPGTGKSQTIANLIARAIKQGKRVLFVAERREAIDVVYERLEGLGLTLPILRVFALTRDERDRVLEDLYTTLQYLMRAYPGPSPYPPEFPERAYDYEQRYFALLTETVDSLNLYGAIGEMVLRERELGKWGLINIADKYHGRGVWENYERIDELALQTYWDKVVEFSKLSFVPKRAELRAVPMMISFLEGVEGRFGDISHQEIVALLKLTRGLYDVLRSAGDAQVLEHLLRLDKKQRQNLREVIQQLTSCIERLRGIREGLNALPTDEEISAAEEALLQYRSWWRRAFSSDYRALRAELERGLGLSKRSSYEDALDHLEWLKRCRRGLEKEEEKVRKSIQELAQQIRDGCYARLILPLDEKRLKDVLSIVERLLKHEESPGASEGVEFLERDPRLFRDFVDRVSAEELDSMIGLLEEVPESGGVRILLNSLREIQEIIRGIGDVGLDTIMDLIEEINRFPALRELISDIPRGTSFQQFKKLIEYLKLREFCSLILKEHRTNMDYRLVEGCRNRIKEFYVEGEVLIAGEWLNEWVEKVSEEIGPEAVKGAYYGYAIPRRRGPASALDKFYDRLSREYGKRHKRISLRELFNEHLPQILEVKPVLMMSPAAVSALLPRDFLEPIFDLVVFDEASQMRVEMALPSIARGRQLITIGDEKQMPPSRYFERLAFFAEEEEEGEELPESLLQACLQAPRGFFKELWLEWYYRGSHESLIAFSNKNFYENRLIVLPSPSPGDRRVEFVYVSCPSHPNGGCYIEGRGINPCEARAVVRRLLEELSKLDDENFTIGIVAMNDRQQDIIEDLLEMVCRESDLNRIRELLGLSGVSLDMFSGEVERGCSLEITGELVDRLEAMLNEDRIWVRNLESVQGKEADIVILSMTYGRGRDGRLRQQFGPVNREGGERRINVLISRARERMIVVSSMRHTDLRVEEGTPRGVRILRDFLRYAEEGGKLVEEGEGGWFESPFEESVYHFLLEALSDLGVEIVPQVGVGKYRIDLGIRKGGRYLLGIECDGALYHKHRAARERDRIREECLRRMGWNIYHIWSTAWFDRSLRTQIIEEIRGLVLERLREAPAAPP